MTGAVLAGFALGLIEVFVGRAPRRLRTATPSPSPRSSSSSSLRPRGLFGAPSLREACALESMARAVPHLPVARSPTSASTRSSALSVYTTLSCGQLALVSRPASWHRRLRRHAPDDEFRAPFAVALAAAALLPALVAVPLGLPVLRLRGVFLAIATIASARSSGSAL